MKVADKGEEGQLAHPSAMMGCDLPSGSPGLPPGAPFLTLSAGSRLPGGVQDGGTTAKLVPILWGCWGVTEDTRPDARGGTNPLPVLPSTAPPPPEPAKIPPQWPGMMENHGHGHKHALASSLRGGSRHPWGRASLPACPELNHGARPPRDRVPLCPAEGDSPHSPREGWKRSHHFLCQLLRAVTITSKIRSHVWLAGEVAPRGPSGFMSPHWAPAAGGTGAGQPPGTPLLGRGSHSPSAHRSRPSPAGRRQGANLCSDSAEFPATEVSSFFSPLSDNK